MTDLAICKILEKTVKEQITENVAVSFHPNAKNYQVRIWMRGIAAGTMKTTRKKWNRIVSTLKSYCTDLKKAVDVLHPDVHVTLMLLNDMNHSNTLLSITDGAVLYDFKEKKATYERTGRNAENAD